MRLQHVQSRRDRLACVDDDREPQLLGKRELLFGARCYRAEHAGYNDLADVAALEEYLASQTPENWTVAETAAVQRETGPRGPVASAPAIAVARLRRDYGERPALRDVTLELAAGETLAVLGPNGAGKTTLLRVLAALLRPTAGEVSVLGCSLPREAWKLRGRVGYLGHEPLLYRDLTGVENLRFQARLHGLEDLGTERISRLLDWVGMSRHADDLVRSLSAGMVQRLAVCRAALHEPDLLHSTAVKWNQVNNCSGTPVTGCAG